MRRGCPDSLGPARFLTVKVKAKFRNDVVVEMPHLTGGRRWENLGRHRGRFRLGVRRNFFPGIVVRSWKGLLRAVGSEHPWKCSNTKHGWHFMVWFRFNQRLDLVILEVLSNPNDSVKWRM